MTVYINWSEETYYTDSAEIFQEKIVHNDMAMTTLLAEYLHDDYDISLATFTRLAGDKFEDWMMDIQDDPRYSDYVDSWFADYLDECYEVFHLDDYETYYIVWETNEIGTCDELFEGKTKDEISYLLGVMDKIHDFSDCEDI